MTLREMLDVLVPTVPVAVIAADGCETERICSVLDARALQYEPRVELVRYMNNRVLCLAADTDSVMHMSTEQDDSHSSACARMTQEGRVLIYMSKVQEEGKTDADA